MKELRGRYTNAKMGKRSFLSAFILALALSVSACGSGSAENQTPENRTPGREAENSPAPPLAEEIAQSFEPGAPVEIPGYSGEAYAVINGNVPLFDRENLPEESFEYYSDLDELGRCKAACVNVGQDIMPDGEREGIGQVKPSGWQTVKYDNVEGKYLYNRCHLIGYQLSAENANEKNLITGTRYMNVKGMLPFENMIADYVKETGNHVLYRVTPVYDGDNLLADGVLMEGWSVEDRGDGICFHVFAYNIQPGIVIDYATGDSYREEDTPEVAGGFGGPALVETAGEEGEAPAQADTTYILNTNTHKFHIPGCGSAKQITEKNRQTYTGNRSDVVGRGYDPCKECNP